MIVHNCCKEMDTSTAIIKTNSCSCNSIAARYIREVIMQVTYMTKYWTVFGTMKLNSKFRPANFLEEDVLGVQEGHKIGLSSTNLQHDFLEKVASTCSSKCRRYAIVAIYFTASF